MRGREGGVARLNVDLQAEKLQALKALAAARGWTVSLYIDELIQGELAKAARTRAREEATT
jgi:predicted DNA binding CopG/RHH family protein